MNLPNDRKYSASHEWALDEQGLVVIGISDFAQDQLGDVVFVELPPIGKSVKAGEAVAVVESVKTASDIYSPVDGEVVEVNSDLDSKPELVNQDPYGSGWIFKIKPAGGSQLEGLLDADGYRRLAEDQN